MYIPKSWPLMNTCTTWPVDWTMRVGSSPPRRKDSDKPISTLQKHRQKMNYRINIFKMVYKTISLTNRSGLPSYIPKIITCILCYIYLFQETMSSNCWAFIHKINIFIKTFPWEQMSIWQHLHLRCLHSNLNKGNKSSSVWFSFFK